MEFPTSYVPESIIFALDVDKQVSLVDIGSGSSRLDALKQCICAFVSAKKRVCSGHRFGLVLLRERASWFTRGCVDSAEELIEALLKISPDSSLYSTCELGSLYSICKSQIPLEERKGNKVRVVLLYGRSATIPEWQENPDCALAIDAIYVHDRVEPGLNCPQQVYNALEDHLDQVSSRTRHIAYIFECTSSNTRKLFTNLTYALWHPTQRPAQMQLPPTPVDLHSIAPLVVGVSSSPPLSPCQAPAATAPGYVPSAPPAGYMTSSGMQSGQQQPLHPTMQPYPVSYSTGQASYAPAAGVAQPSFNTSSNASPALGLPVQPNMGSAGHAYYQQQYSGGIRQVPSVPHGYGTQQQLQGDTRLGNVMVGVVLPTSATGANQGQTPPTRN